MYFLLIANIIIMFFRQKKKLGNIITTFILSSCLDFRISEATNDLLSYSVATPPNV